MAADERRSTRIGRKRLSSGFMCTFGSQQLGANRRPFRVAKDGVWVSTFAHDHSAMCGRAPAIRSGNSGIPATLSRKLALELDAPALRFPSS